MKVNKNKITILILGVIVLLTCVVGLAVKYFMPSKEVMELTEYYKVPPDKIMVVVQDKPEEAFGLYIDGVAYVDYEVVKENMNKRFYWDSNENILSYTTPTEVVKAGVNSPDYYVAKSKTTETYPIVKALDEKVYIAMDFVKKYSNVEYEVFQNPNRIVIQCKWGENFLYAEVKKDTQLRVETNIKSKILEQLTKGTTLLYVDTDEEAKKGFHKVMTSSGVTGFVKASHLKESTYVTLQNDYKEAEYSHIKYDKKVCLAWHQVTNAQANENLLNVLNNTKGLTVISPTWFSVINNEGDISSLASEKYVQRAKNAGVEVWALCDDFNKEVKMGVLLSYTSKREKLINQLVSTAIKYNLDGLNIDFEKIPKNAGEHYIQFIRELSVKCRLNGIVLSIDNYAPSSYTAHYHRSEQGEVADYIITMAYDEHYAGGGVSGSVSSIGFVKDSVKNTIEQVPPERTIIALPFYTRLWKEEEVKGKVKVTAQAYGMSSADTLLQNNGTTAQWDAATGQYYAEFKEGKATFKIWLEEETSLEEKLKVVKEGNVAGVAFWKLGFERERVWDTIQKYIK